MDTQTIDSMLRNDGLSLKMLHDLSYTSSLDMSLKRTLAHFDKTELMRDLATGQQWLDYQTSTLSLSIDYRVKALQSIALKYERYFPNRPVSKVFNDLLGFRTLCNDYAPILTATTIEHFSVADMSQGKAADDGYRGIHVYFQLDNHHYPIEIQYNTFYDRQLNNWLHKYIYKKDYPLSLGQTMRKKYEQGLIHTETDFTEVMHHVLSDSKGL